MSGKSNWGLLRMMVAFFAGALTCLFLLVPGKKGPTILINGNRDQQVAELDKASRKVENISGQALDYAYKAKNFLHQKISQQN